jgi:hypothetical protein
MSNTKPAKVSLGILFFFLTLLNSAIIVNAQEYEKVKFGNVIMTKMSWENENKYLSEPIEVEKDANTKLANVDNFIKSRGYELVEKDTKTITEVDNKITIIKANCELYNYKNTEKSKMIVLTKAERHIINKSDGVTIKKDTYEGKNYILYVEVSEYKEIKMADI